MHRRSPSVIFLRLCSGECQIGPIVVQMDTTYIEAMREALAAVIRAEHARADMSLEEFAAAAGLSKSTIGRFEAGMRDPDTVQLSKLAHALGVAPSYLMVEAERRISRPFRDSSGNSATGSV